MKRRRESVYDVEEFNVERMVMTCLPRSLLLIQRKCPKELSIKSYMIEVSIKKNIYQPFLVLLFAFCGYYY